MSERKEGTTLLYGLIAEARTYPDAIVLGRGDPDFDTPQYIVEAARDAMLEDPGGDVPTEGLPALREAIAERVKKVNGIDIDPDSEVVFTNGGQEALFLMVVACMDEGDELLVPDPNYNAYNDALRFAGGTKVKVPTCLEEDFRVHPERMRAAITDRTKAMLLVSPANPSAGVIAPEDVRELVRIAEENDLIIFADDTYDLFVYDDYEHLSPASVVGGKGRTLTVNTLSKTYAMTGWRAGWLVGPANLVRIIKELKAAVTGGSPLFTQYGALAALQSSSETVEKMQEIYACRRRIVLDALESMGIPYGMPQGGQFVFANISSTGMKDIELVERVLAEQHVLIYPGSGFSDGWDDYVRITFLQPEEKLREGLERVELTMRKVLAS